MMTKRLKPTDQQLVQRIAGVLQHGRFLSKAEAKEAAFHLTDWLADLARLNRLLQSPAVDAASDQEVLLAFVAHAPAHLAAAHRIVMGSPVTDVFELGAVKGSGRAKCKPGKPSSARTGHARGPKRRSEP